MKGILPILVSLLLIGSSTVMGQEKIENLSVSELYKEARTVAFEDRDYSKARKYLYEVLERSPDYHEVRIFIARLYSWEENYDSARNELRRVLKEDPGNRSAYLAIVDVESWSGNYDKALLLASKGIDYHPEDEELLLKKASVLYNMEEYEKSEKVYEKIIEDNADSRKAAEGLEAAKRKQMKYNATVSYRYDHFVDTFDPWKFTEIGLSRQTSFGSITGRAQYARRFGSSGTQFNLDAYPSIMEGMYAYISGGYSESFIYPKYRFGLSLYKTLPASFELEAGMRYLDFEDSQAEIYTFSLTKYWNSYLFTLQNYLVPTGQNNSNSFRGIMRRYFGNENVYLSITGGYGSANTEIEFSQDIEAHESWSIGLDGQYLLSHRFLIGGYARFDSSKYQNFLRDRFSFKGFVTYRF